MELDVGENERGSASSPPAQVHTHIRMYMHVCVTVSTLIKLKEEVNLKICVTLQRLTPILPCSPITKSSVLLQETFCPQGKRYEGIITTRAGYAHNLA